MPNPDRPTLHLTNWSSPKLHGPGRKLTIMARPRAWEVGEGTVIDLAPQSGDFTTAMMIQALAERGTAEGEVSMHRYKTAMESRWQIKELALGPRHLLWIAPPGMGGGMVSNVHDGDTLCCACAKGVECHRRWAAPFLVRAGWRVILDGVEVVL